MKRNERVLRGVDFGPIWGMSGVQGFFGEGYPFHKPLHFIPGFGFEGMTFVAKTSTLNRNEGYMPLKEDGLTPREWFPKCIKIKRFSKIRINGRLYTGLVLNSVGLSGFGLDFLLNQGRWQVRKEPFQISFMAIQEGMEAQLNETMDFACAMFPRMSEFGCKFGVQVNVSCPNVGRHHDELVDKARGMLNILKQLQVPIILKINTLVPPQVAKTISEHPACDAICVTNTIPWGALSEQIPWKNIFGSDRSPLETRGFKPGGLSGRFLKPLVIKWVDQARGAGLTKHINAGGGISCASDVDDFKNAGASSVSLGATATILAPWNVRSIIRRAHKLWKDQ